MLKVTINNIDQVYIGIMDTDNTDLAAKWAVFNLKAACGFFPTCTAYKVDQEEPARSQERARMWGIVTTPSDIRDQGLEYLMDDVNTYSIRVEKMVPGHMELV